ncbi:MAG TPA: DUF732 domain-containing protein [Mycobacterium sp.]|jgi:thymidine phosphorylase|uniref:DUF732 domain-containing protein n=1 Tax=Mycobacterium sp. TaxID=1785 RepID=UPI002D7096CD|nr:DUF732 domain-containing protein [Mycobacterium sp.]HZU46107.1 DUF732 domain-containing protein [Mycobacterium sp.]
MRLVIAALLVLASLASAAMSGIAVAHAAGDSDYLMLLNRYGFDVSTVESQQLTLKLGHAICNDLRSDATPQQKQAMAFQLGAASSVIVSAAQLELCPDTISEAQAGGR